MAAFMMDSGGMAKDPVWEPFITVMVMCFMEHGGMVYFMERFGSLLHSVAILYMIVMKWSH
jgi:hypothetical protein